jgi:hypothetical protein
MVIVNDGLPKRTRSSLYNNDIRIQEKDQRQSELKRPWFLNRLGCSNQCGDESDTHRRAG